MTAANKEWDRHLFCLLREMVVLVKQLLMRCGHE